MNFLDTVDVYGCGDNEIFVGKAIRGIRDKVFLATKCGIVRDRDDAALLFSPRFQGENFQKNLDLVARVESIAKEKKCKPSQLALAWLLAQGENIIPIPSTKRRKYLEENHGALSVKLSASDWLASRKSLRTALRQASVIGTHNNAD
jgi:aryl-alcohol dehydrogenase-like predicted oxidoreductase